MIQKNGSALRGRKMATSRTNGLAMGLPASYCELGTDTGLRSMWARTLHGQATSSPQAPAAAMHPSKDT